MSDDANPAPPETMVTRNPAHSSTDGLNPSEWVDAHSNYLFRYALIRVRDEGVAEDMVQEALLAAFKARDHYTEGASERGWLTGILRHKILDHFRQVGRDRAIFHEQSLPPELDERFDDLGQWKTEPPLSPKVWGPDAASQMQSKEFMAALKQCLAKLPQRCADAFVLREMEAVDSKEIQEFLDVTAANLWVLLHRARMQLRLCLEKNWINV
ncbi:MAG: sigma-70 family RNA polymerase sigma factor [Verrucomicrobia bacterium]|nr:sigma-70 family RNA polymerase sigma factor [Verrucomicrobiota bacterium]